MLSKKLRSYEMTIKIESLHKNTIESKLRTILQALNSVNENCTLPLSLESDNDTLFQNVYNTLQAYASRQTFCGRLRTHDDYRQHRNNNERVDYTTIVCKESNEHLEKLVALFSSIEEISKNDLQKVAKLLGTLDQRVQGQRNS